VGARVVVALAAVLLVALAAPTTAPAQESGTPLTVTGRGTVDARPDRAEVTYVVQRFSRTREGARSFVARRSRLVLRRLRAIGIDPLAIRLSEVVVVRRSSRRKLEKPFVATATIAATTARPTISGRMIDLGARAGADVRGPQFELVDDLAAREQATTRAVTSARRRAEAVAAGLGQRIVAIRSITLDGATTSDEGRFDPQLAQGEAGGGGGIPAAPGTIRVTASVTVVFQLEQA
jgi:uncharacterized protein